jgi:membrane fusion protein (multidrug efflux system)
LQAGAGTQEARADAARADQDLARFRHVDPDAVARQQVDAATAASQAAHAKLSAATSAERSARAQVLAARTQVQAADASIALARAALGAAELQLGYARVVASTDGRITRRQVEVGNVVNVGQPLLAIVGTQLWVIANYKETQLAKMQPGQAVEVTADAYPDAHFKAHVDSIQRGTGAYFSALPAENATGNFVKVVQRVPVKIVFDDDSVERYAVGPGMSVTPDVSIP